MLDGFHVVGPKRAVNLMYRGHSITWFQQWKGAWLMHLSGPYISWSWPATTLARGITVGKQEVDDAYPDEHGMYDFHAREYLPPLLWPFHKTPRAPYVLGSPPPRPARTCHPLEACIGDSHVIEGNSSSCACGWISRTRAAMCWDLPTLPPCLVHDAFIGTKNNFVLALWIFI